MHIIHRRRGQVTVELMLILPVFMLLIFFVLEYGNIAYRTLVLNHASYEFARIASLKETVAFSRSSIASDNLFCTSLNSLTALEIFSGTSIQKKKF